MNRRTVLAGATSVLSPAGTSAGAVSDDPAAWLGATTYIDVRNPNIRSCAVAATSAHTTDRAKALALFEVVRDQILFGFGRGFWDQKASDVLALGRGFCNTKSTLFVALLRAAGVPARQVFVDIDVAVLHGIVSPGTPYVDHSFVEVFLDGAWRATDAYIADPALFAAARRRLVREGRVLGYGVHVTGENTWGGLQPTYAQFNINDPRPISTRRHGVFADVGDFYARGDRPWNRLNPWMRAGFGALAAGGNRNAAAIRASRPRD